MRPGQRRDLNYAEALRRAQTLWGSAGAVELRRNAAPELQRVVGTKGAARAHSKIGYGRTWAEAFENAGTP